VLARSIHPDGTWGSLLTFLAESEQTYGRFALIEYDSKLGNEPPPHVHEREDEFYYVLEGKVDAYVGREVFNAGAGECFFFPRRTPHGFVIRSPRLRALILISPAGFEKYFSAMSSPAENLDLPPDAITYSQGTPEQAVRVAAELGLRFLSPGEIAEQMPAFPGVSAPSNGSSTPSDEI
jgi:mannose-6-phosphate isomerase-like protein (cupin superfamily)